jgi:amino acid adenylation domain-containing protein
MSGKEWTPSGLLKALRDQGGSIRRDGDRLAVRSPAEGLPTELTDLLRAHRHELLEFLRSAEGLPPMTRVEGQEGPLSYAQHRMWFLNQLDGEFGVYNIPMAWRLGGKIDIPALERAIQLLGEREETLRTRFEQRGDELLQVIGSEAPQLEHRSVESLEHCRVLVSELGRERLDPEAGPPWRAMLFTTPAGEHVLFLNFHHVLIDGNSISLVMRELSTCYRVALGEAPDESPRSELRYLDYAVWLNGVVEAGAYADHLRFWLDQLKAPLPVLNLPTDHRRPARRSVLGETRRLRLEPGLIAGLETRARAEQTTLFTALLTGFYALLQRYAGQDDLVVGTPVSIRGQPELQSMIGLFMNTLALRNDLSDDPSLSELLRRTRDLCTRAFAHQDLPFEHLVPQLTLERDASRTPVFQAQFAFRDARDDDLVFTGAPGTTFPLDRCIAPTDLAFWVERTGDDVHVEVEFPTALFHEATIDQMLVHYRRVLETLIEDPRQRLSEISWLTDNEHHQLIETWNATESSLPDGTMLDRFAEQVARRPDAVAVRCRDAKMTYAQLDRASDAVAARLHTVVAGLEEQPVVGICMPRSELLLVALLGVWKAGCAYLPLDPGFPRDRLAFMVADAGAATLLVDSCTELPIDFTGPVLAVDNMSSGAEKVTHAEPGEMAYLIYTSGSTGKPKGVRVGHREVLNLLTSMAREPGLTEEDALLAVTTLSFDISVLELFLPLTVGASVEVVTREEIADAHALAHRINESGATVMQATPSTWRLLVESDWAGQPGLRALCGGEALSRDLAASLLPRVGSLWNLYGPTETTVWSTCDEITDPSQRISVGRPIDNTRVYILDEHLRPVPRGVPGELFIAGTGVTLGYHRRPDQTRDRFLPDPFHAGGDKRMYRTGDLARHLPDGRLELLGRSDNQVKLRGFRIELGEIEEALKEEPGITDAVTKIHELTPSDQRLVAYVTLEAGSRLSVVALRKRLRQLLPDYMIPQAFETLDALPLTPNGKIDRRALPKPATFVAHSQDGDPPATNAERRIAAIWSELLGCGQISLADNFFELGGHSLLAMQASRRIAETFGCRMPPQALVMQSLREIAAEVEAPAVAL